MAHSQTDISQTESTFSESDFNSFSPLQRFLEMDAAGGILLVLSAFLALILANSPFASSYFEFLDTLVVIRIGQEGLSDTLIHVVNDGLMAIFFLLIGLEIKREVLEGELSTFRKAAMPFMAAIGGMVVPVGLFLFLQRGQAGVEAWGVPMATDIAFSIGILTLLGSRVPLGMKVFLSAFAIVDDIGAVLVIALFYTKEIDWSSLTVFLILLGILGIFNWVLSIKRLWPYLTFGIVAWAFLLESGIHPTIAGVLIALTIPSNNRVRLKYFAERAKRRREKLMQEEQEREGRFLKHKQVELLYDYRTEVKRVVPPVQRLEYSLENFVAFFVLPLFAFANAGVALNGGFNAFTAPLTLHIALALVLGKVIGIFSFSWLAVGTGMADLPSGARWIHMIGLGLLGGIGFTMAIFIATLALEEEVLLSQAKLGILLASLVAGLAGYFLLHATLPKTEGANE